MPAVNIEHQPGGSVIAVWEITETEETLVQHLSMPDSCLAEIMLTANPQRRLERLAVQALLNKLAGEKACLRHHANGKPFLLNSTLNISISHTKGFAAVMYNEKHPVGCDMECLTRNFSAVEKKALSKKERRYLSHPHRNLQLCLLWCAKEAIYKCVEEDGVDFARQIFVEKFTPEEKGKLIAIYTNNKGEETKFELHYKTIDEHVLVWTVNNE